MSSVTGAGEERANFAAAATPTGEVGSSERRVIAGKVWHLRRERGLRRPRRAPEGSPRS